MRQRIKNSIGIRAFGPNATRFVPGGYHFEARNEGHGRADQAGGGGVRRLCRFVRVSLSGEVNEETLETIQTILTDAGKDLYCVAIGFHCMDEFIQGSFINPDPQSRSLP